MPPDEPDDIPRLDPKPSKDWHKLELRGAAVAVQKSKDREVLFDGPAGSGKSLSVCCIIVSACLKHPGIRVLIGRKTRASMSQTILVTFESVLDMFGQQSVHETQRRPNRTYYRFANGSEVVAAGFDDPERVKSSDYDIIAFCEATEMTEDDYEIAMSRLRNNKMGYHKLIADCNPGPPNHWLLSRVASGAMVQFQSSHKDNPALYELFEDGGRKCGRWTDLGREYVGGTLEALTGTRRQRLLLGRWVSAEGAVFESSWRPGTHMIDPGDVPTKGIRSWWASVDWGFRDPGVINIWGVDGDYRVYRVRGLYRTERTINWWIVQAKRLMIDYPDIQGWICDSSRPDYIKQFRDAGIAAIEADRRPGSIEFGLRLIEQRLADQGDGHPALYFARGSTGWYDDSAFTEGPNREVVPPPPDVAEDRWMRRHEKIEVLPTSTPAVAQMLGDWVPQVDPTLRKKNHPTTTEEEFYVYAYPATAAISGVIPVSKRETPMDQHNHGIDTTRYVLRYIEDGLGGGGSVGGNTVSGGLESDDMYEPYVDEEAESMM